MVRRPSRQWLRSLGPRVLATVRTQLGPRQPVRQLDQHMELAVGWLVKACSIGHDGGVPAFYDLLRDLWAPSYPETTGYLVPTVLACAQRRRDETLRSLALAMAAYALRVQTPAGAIPGWSNGQQGYVFDTGQVLFGWLAAFTETGDRAYYAALLRAASWLVSQQDAEGYWTRYQYGGHVKTWDARVAWPLLLAGRELGRPEFVEAGRRCLEWVLTQQDMDGWFRHSALEPGQLPVTHTIAYTIEALLESGSILGEGRYVQAACAAADALAENLQPDGSLRGPWAPGWRPQGRSGCLTGIAQMSLCWLRLFQISGEARYLDAGERALGFVASTQCLDDCWPPIRGAVAGSWPIWGHYLSWRYPNWAVKFFVDALLLQQDVVRAGTS